MENESVRQATLEEESLYLGSQLGVHGEFANVAWVVKVRKGRLDPDKLSRAVAALVEVHPALKSVFFTGKEGATYVGSTGSSVKLEVIDFSLKIPDDPESLPDMVRLEEQAVKKLNELARIPIDPRGPEPLLRLYLLQYVLMDGEEFDTSSKLSQNLPFFDGGQWLLLNAHHAIADGTSMKILFEDLATLYDWDPKTNGDMLAEMRKRMIITPGMIAQREKSRLDTGSWVSSLEYWKQQLQGSNGQLVIPSIGSPTPQTGPGASASIPFAIDKETVLHLRKIGETAGSTLFSVLIAGLSVLLCRWSGDFDLNLGTVVAGRKDNKNDAYSFNDKDIERFVGCLVNTITLRMRCSSDMSFLDLVRLTKSVLAEAVAHSDVPFTLVRQEYADGVQSPYQVSIVKQDSRLPRSFEVQGIEAEVDPLYCDVAAIQQDLIFEVLVRPDGIVSGRLRFKTERFDETFSNSMTHQYKTILEAAAGSPHLLLRSIPLLDEEGKSNFIHLSAGRTSLDWAKAQLVHESFETHALRRPNQCCLELDGTSITYKAVNQASDAVASTLQNLGVQNGQLVGVMLDRSFDLFIAILGVLKSGSTYLPLDPSYPLERLQGYVQDGGCPVLMTQSESRTKAEALTKNIACKVLDVSTARAMGSRMKLDKRTSISWESPAYCIFTSGSTGRPKGVLVPHRALTDFTVFNKEFYKLDCDSRVLMTISICFDPHILQSLVPLAAGSTVVIARPGGHLDGKYVAYTMLKSGVTAMTAGVPTLVAEYVEAMEQCILESPNNSFSNLQWWGMGGESLSLDLVQNIHRVAPFCQVVNDYGPTEVTVSCIKHLCASHDTRIVIGRPDTNVHAYIVDANLQPVPAGAAGELLLSGPRVALGYMDRKELTKEKFVANPFVRMIESLVPSEMLEFYQTAYRSGDLVRWLPDANIDFLGRIDRQIKIMGTRIELGEVENTIACFPGVRKVLATAVSDPTGIKRLVAYITPENLDVQEIAAYCREKMITAMVPTAIVKLSSLPLMKNGKVDVKSLPKPDWNNVAAISLYNHENALDAGDVDADDSSLAVMSQTERLIAKTVQGILGRSAPPKVDVDLTLLGLNSIKAMKLLHAINSSLGSTLGFKEIMEKPLIEAIAKKAVIAETLESNVYKSSKLQRVYDPSRYVYPASSAQKRLWINAINNPGALRSTSVHDVSGVEIVPKVLSNAANIVSHRHVILRTLYEISDDGELLQVVDLERDIQVRVYRADGPEAAEETCAQFLEQPFILDEDLPFRILLIPYDKEEKRQLLVLDLHHICIDGWSSSLFLQELSKEYTTACQEKSTYSVYNSQEKLPLQYIDVAAAQDAALSSAKRNKQLQFWKETLLDDNEERKVLELGDLKPPKGRIGKEKIIEIPIDTTLSNELRQAFRSAGCSLHSGFMALLQVQLSIENGGSEKFVVGTVVAGRTLPESESTIGFFVNTLAVPANIKKSALMTDFLKQVNGTLLECYDNADVSFIDVLSECHDSSEGPLINVMFAMQTDWLEPFHIYGAESSALMPEGGSALFPLSFQVADCGDDAPFLASLKYDASLFSEERAQRLADHFILVMDKFTSDPTTLLGEISVLTETEKTLLLNDWINDFAPWPTEVLAHQIFQKHVEKMPDKVAAWYGNNSITYAELDRMSNQLANCLQSENVGPDVMVTVLMGRCLEFIICVLAVNKAGGAYIPLDEEYPDERLQYIMKDSATPVLLTLEKLADKASLAPKGCHTMYVDIGSWDDGPGKFPTTQPLCKAIPESLVYCIYTSGTTGNPKGTMLEHRNLVAYLHSHTSRYPLYTSDVFSHLITISFDASIHEYWLSIFAGGSLVIVPGKEAMAPFDTFKRFGVSVSIFPTALWDVFASQTEWNELPSLRMVAVGGDVLRKGKPADCSFELCNSYGPTEITVMCTAYTTKFDENYPCIGRPLPNSRCYVVDNQLHLLPIGVPGELVVGGPGVARGYHNQPTMSAEKFIADPFSTDPHAKLYRTGDVVRWRSNGTLDFIGRADSQVKIRGFRIEISEVESVLLKVPGVDEGLVVARIDPARNRKVLVAYAACYTNRVSNPPDSNSIKTFMSSQLPDYMVPSYFVLISHKLPRTANGKYDRKALPAPENEPRQTKASNHDGTENDLDEIARSVMAIIRDVLGMSEDDPISLQEDIFELGADSLQAALIVSRIRKLLDVSMEMRQIYEDGRVENLVNNVRDQKTGGGNATNNAGSGMRNGAKVRRSSALGLQVSTESAPWSMPKRVLVPIIQLIASLVIILCFLGSMAPGYGVFMVLYLVVDVDLWLALVCLPAFFFCWGLTLILVSVVLKWILIGKYNPGIYSIWGPYFTRWWIVHRVVVACRPVLRALPEYWLTLYYRLMGAQFKSGVCILSKDLSDFDLLSIGSNTFIGKDVTIVGHVIERGRLLLGPVVIGNRCSIGMLSFISPESTIDDDVTLSAMTLVPIGSALPPGSSWLGSPARRQEQRDFQLLRASSRGMSQRMSRKDITMRRSFSTKSGKYSSLHQLSDSCKLPSTIIFCLGIWKVISAVVLMGISFYPFALAIFYAAEFNVSLSVLVLGFSFVGAHLVYICLVALMKWIILGRAKPGTYHLNSWYAQRFAMVACWLQMPFALGFCTLFSNTPILILGLKALGARLGGNNIILNPSTMSLPGVDQWELAEGTVFGGNAALMGFVIEKDVLIIGRIRIGTDCFLGDNAVILPGASMFPSSLAGTLTLIDKGKVLDPGSVWVGSPAICLDKGVSSIHAVVNADPVSKLKSLKSHSLLIDEQLIRRTSRKRSEGKDLQGNIEVRLSGFTSEKSVSKRNILKGHKGHGFYNNSKRSYSSRLLDKVSAELFNPESFVRGQSMASSIVEVIENQKTRSILLTWGPIFVSIVVIPLYLTAVFIGPINLLFYCATEKSIGLAIGLAPVYLLMIGVATAGLLLAFKWLTIGRFQPASYSLQNAAMFFWWTSLISLSDFAMFLFLGFILGTEWATWYLRAGGATIGEDTYLDGIPTVEYDLLKVGDRCTIGEGASTIGHTLENNMLNFLNINIGNDSSVGSMSHVLPNSIIENQAGIGALSLVMKGEQLGEGWWEGSPVSFGGKWYDSICKTDHKRLSESLKRELTKDGKIAPGQLFLPPGGLPRKTGPPRSALLTGATGFVGAFLLRELLDYMDKVYCLVRAASADAGMQRIQANMMRYSLIREEEWPRFSSKIVPLLGDLGQRNLGLGRIEFEQLAHIIDIIYHNGAMVNMSFGYSALKPPNVGGTLECLRLATLTDFATPVHYISTEGVLPTSIAEYSKSPGVVTKGNKKLVVTEAFILEDPDSLHDNGYDHSKWVAEHLVLDAASRDQPVAIYRLGRIGSDSRTGASNTDDFLILFVKGCLQLKCFPASSTFEFPINIIPADIAASRIREISMSESPATGIYHIGNPDPPSYSIVTRTLKEMGYEFQLLPYQMWRQRLIDSATEDNALKPLENAFDEGHSSLEGPLVECSRAGIHASPLQPKDLKSCFKYLQSTGFFPLP